MKIREYIKVNRKRNQLEVCTLKNNEKNLTSLKNNKSERKKIYITSSFDKKRKNHNNIIIKMSSII